MSIKAAVKSLILDRRGTSSIETLTLLPVFIALLILGLYISETVRGRNVYFAQVRTIVMNASATGSCLSSNLLGQSEGMFGIFSTVCTEHRDEDPLSAGDKFWKRTENAASAYRELITTVTPSAPVSGATGTGVGDAPGRQVGSMFELSGATYILRFTGPGDERWIHSDDPFRVGQDQVLYDELKKRGSHQLFPNVFPAAR